MTDRSSQDDRQSRFTSEYAAASRRIYSAVTLCVATHQEADDVMQEVCLVLWRKFDEYEPGTNFVAWGRAIAFRVAREHARRTRRHRGIGLDDRVLAKLAAVHQGVGELLELRQELLQDCVAKLPQGDRDLIRRSYGGEESVVEIAKESRRPLASLYTRLKRLRGRLFDCVNRGLGRAEGRR
ncbi:MAG: sigma-70 family RNA polymerase sigma factor [Planctomycetota bacterium]